MQKAVAWWCDLIGVTDPVAVQTATGTAAALALLFAVIVVWTIIGSFLNWSARQP